MRKPKKFDPTPAMHLYAFQRSKLGSDATEKEIAEKIGIRNATISHWKNIAGYHEWLEEQIAVYSMPIIEMLETTALRKLDNFNYWHAMALRHGFYGQLEKGLDPAQLMKEGKFIFLKGKK